MKFRKPISVLAAAGILFAGGIGLSSCSNKISEEQLLEISKLKKEKKSLQGKINTKKGELSEIERELSAIDAKKDDCNKRQKFVKEKLAKWPNMWPDWSPEQEKKETEEEVK